jgi:hypothetical protein
MLQVPLTLFDQAIEGVTISQYATGLPNDQADTTKGTATGIMRLQQAAGDVVTFFKENFMQSMLQIGRMWLSNNQQFMLRDVTVTTNKPDGPTSMKISRKDMQGDINLTIDEASMEPLSQQDRITQAQAFIQQITLTQDQSIKQNQALGTQPLAVDYTMISEYLADQYNLKGFSKLLIPQAEITKLHNQQMKETAQHMVQAQQQAGQQAQQPPPMKSPVKLPSGSVMETGDLVKLYPLVSDGEQDQILEILGITPDGQPSQVAKKALISGLGQVTKTQETGHKAAMDKLNLAHELSQSAHGQVMDKLNMAQNIAQQPPEQPATQPQPAQAPEPEPANVNGE